ncbi:MAG: uroporphyrinogen decarboxylase family protein [Promethearchaeota archaeon]
MQENQVTPFERVIAAIRGEPPDRVPVIPQITYTTAQLTGVGLVEALHSPEKTAKALLAGQRELEYDAIYAGWESSFNLLAEAMGCTMRYPEDDVPQVTSHIVQDSSDLDKVPIPDPERAGRIPIHIETVKIVKREVGGKVPIFCYVPGPFTLAGQIHGVNKLMIATIRDRKFVDDLTRITTEASKSYVEANIRAGADVIVAADPTASSSLISPEMFKTLAAPCLEEVLAVGVKNGVIPALHVCGQTTPILELMCDTGAKILEIDHLVDLGKAKQEVGDRVCLQGNIDPTDLLLTGTPEAVEQAAKSCIEQAAAKGRFILSSGCEIPPLAPLPNIQAMVNAAKKYGRYT